MITTAHNFREIFSDITADGSVAGIVIPIVQRDYAQGRNTPDVARIRNRFLNVLYEAVTQDKPTTLDFIYGNIEDGMLIPLDGQQRLTTLFLLHYYVAMHEQISLEEKSFLKNFTYKTRISSRDFCEHLVEFEEIDFTKQSLSEQITDQAWFLLEWYNDPTVRAMLVMLDAIHDKFSQTSNVWPKLTGDAITFYFLPLDEMGVTDELYIKMNSRGKPLSPFEHFKAELELKMKEVALATSNDEERKEIAQVAERISKKIDREWTDLLWPYRNSGIGNVGVDEVTDDEFLRYIHFISDIISYRNGTLEIEDDFDMIDRQFSSSCPSAKENMQMLERWFDLWVWKDCSATKKERLNVATFFDSYISADVYQPNKILLERRPTNDRDLDTIPDLFSECCKCYGRKNGLRPMFPLGRTLLLYSFLIYLENKDKIDDQDFHRRLRIVNNLIRNSSNTLRSDFMKELLLQVDRIIIDGIVEQVEEGRARFQSRQMEEESEKLQWTLQYPEKAETLFKLEDHKFLNGYVGAIGLDHVDWCERVYRLFDCDLACVNRALLSIGDYFEEDGWRYQIGTANPRTYMSVWRTLFSPSRKIDSIKSVLLKLLESAETYSNESLDEIAEHYLETTSEMPVRYYLVKYPQMVPNKFGKYYWREHQQLGRNSYKVIMMTTEFNFGFNYDIFLKTLFDLKGGVDSRLELGNYSYTEYNSNGGDKLYLNDRRMYLTLNNDTYTLTEQIDEGITEEVESYHICQNEQGIDIEDRVQVGLRLLEKYMR